MEIQIGSDALGSGRKRNRSGYEYLRSWRENVEGQLHEETRVKAGLLVLLEQEKRKVKELAEQLMHSKVVVQEHERKVDHLGDELMEMESRVRNLESDKYFLDANLVERSNEVAQLKAECTQLEIKVETLAKSEKEIRQRWKTKQVRDNLHKFRTKGKVLRAFGWEENTADPVLLRAVCGFWGALIVPADGVDEVQPKLKRMSRGDVMKMWKDVTLNGWAGLLRKELLKEFIESKKYCPIQMARSSDVNSTFNVRAASDIAKCDTTRVKYERGLLPSDQTCRRVMQCVYNAAVQIGFSSFPSVENGNVWCWGDADGRFTNGVNRYVYEVYCQIDPNCEMATEDDPWLVPVTGDGTRVSYRGKSITMCGVKQADARLPSQHETGKTMNQSRHMYVPALAGYTDEKSIMPYFEEFIRVFRDIEDRGFCVVDKTEYKVHIRSFVVGDLAFEQKYLQRGGGSGKTTRFCFMCSNTCHFRHKGYPGGCWKCRAAGTVYDEQTGVQICLCHDVCTPDFLKWEKARFEDLSERVGTTIPMSKIPPWESVGALRHECCKRCYTPQDRARLNKMTTEAQMQHWLLARCRQGCTLTANEAHGVRFCPLAMVVQDMKERNLEYNGLRAAELRHRLEMVLREEEEWAEMVMYRRDTRFSTNELGDDMKLHLDRTVVDMLHCPMRTHEKVLNLLYDELLNGKTKNEANGKRRGVKKKKQVVGDVAVGQHVAKLDVQDQGLPVLLRGVIAAYTHDAKGELYSVLYDDGTQADFNAAEYIEAHAFAQLLEKDNTTEEKRLQNLEKKIAAPALTELSDAIRQLGELGASWSHQWEEGKTKALKKIKLPFDQSKKIFKPEKLDALKVTVDIAVGAHRPEQRTNWKEFLSLYVCIMNTLTKSEDYTKEDIDRLDVDITKCYAMLLKVAGMKACTNYFHLLGSGHVIWLTRRYGNLWRWRNEGVEGQNSVLSLRYNKFNNRGGNKGNSANKDVKDKCFPFQVLGAWMARLTMWQLGLGEALFEADLGDREEE